MPCSASGSAQSAMRVRSASHAMAVRALGPVGSGASATVLASACRRHAFQAAKLAAGANTTLCEPAAIHFQRISGGSAGAVVFLTVRCHVGNIDDLSVVIEKSDGERDQGVAHPHAVGVGLGENEQHAALGGHRRAIHQAGLARTVIGGDLCQTINYSWQKRLNACDVPVESRIDEPVAPATLAKLRALPEFVRSFDEHGMAPAEFERYGGFRSTLATFIAGYEDLVHVIRGYMI